MKEYVIVVAGGKGLRMGSAVPKQFLELGGKAIILHTLEKFKEALPQAELLLVLPKNELERWKETSKGTEFEHLKVAFGGKTRFDSVKSGLSEIKETGVVAIHDAVRPFVSIETIKEAIEVAKETGAAIPVVKLKDSIRKVSEEKSHSVNREEYRIVQTPQCFQTRIILDAYQQDYDSSFTDDASVAEKNNVTIQLVNGNNENIKITTLEDLKTGEAFLLS